MSGKKERKQYALATKLEAVRLYDEEGKSQQEIIELLGIRDRRRLRQWLSAYRREGVEAFQAGKTRRGRPPKLKWENNTVGYIARLEMENDLLKKFHAELRKESLALHNIGLSITKDNTTQ